jgi:hypothetical protein
MMKCPARVAALSIFLAAGCSSPAHKDAVDPAQSDDTVGPLAYNEAEDGDLSTDPEEPTRVTFAEGINSITGQVSTGKGDARDIITFNIPAGLELSNLRLTSYLDRPSGLPGNRGFHAIKVGNKGFVPSAATMATSIGGDHVDPVPAAGADLLPALGDKKPGGGTGFLKELLGPGGGLASGDYTYLIQQAGPQVSEYTLQFVVSEAPKP